MSERRHTFQRHSPFFVFGQEMNKPHKDFRLWITVRSTESVSLSMMQVTVQPPDFRVRGEEMQTGLVYFVWHLWLLQNALKVSAEVQSGLKAKLLTEYSKLENALEAVTQPHHQSSIFLVTFLHSFCQVRLLNSPTEKKQSNSSRCLFFFATHRLFF